MRAEIFVWTMRVNLGFIVKFHNESSRLLGNQAFEINNEILNSEILDTIDQKQKNMLLADKEIYTKTFRYMLTNSIFLMMYSYLEEFLYSAAKFFKIETEDKGSIDRFKSVFKDSLKVDLKTDPIWRFIRDCEKIRNCLLHANGRIEFYKRKTEIDQIIANSNSLLIIDKKRLIVTDKYLDKFNTVLYDLIGKIEKEEYK